MSSHILNNILVKGTQSFGASGVPTISANSNNLLTVTTGAATTNSGISLLSSGGTLGIVATASSGPITLSSSGVATFESTGGNTLIDANAVLNLGTASSTSVNISQSGDVTTVKGSLTVDEGATITGDVTITGALTVTGTVTSVTVDLETLSTVDNAIAVSYPASDVSGLDLGLSMHRSGVDVVGESGAGTSYSDSSSATATADPRNFYVSDDDVTAGSSVIGSWVKITNYAAGSEHAQLTTTISLNIATYNTLPRAVVPSNDGVSVSTNLATFAATPECKAGDVIAITTSDGSSTTNHFVAHVSGVYAIIGDTDSFDYVGDSGVTIGAGATYTIISTSWDHYSITTTNLTLDVDGSAPNYTITDSGTIDANIRVGDVLQIHSGPYDSTFFLVTDTTSVSNQWSVTANSTVSGSFIGSISGATLKVVNYGPGLAYTTFDRSVAAMIYDSSVNAFVFGYTSSDISTAVTNPDHGKIIVSELTLNSTTDVTGSTATDTNDVVGVTATRFEKDLTVSVSVNGTTGEYTLDTAVPSAATNGDVIIVDNYEYLISTVATTTITVTTPLVTSPSSAALYISQGALTNPVTISSTGTVLAGTSMVTTDGLLVDDLIQLDNGFLAEVDTVSDTAGTLTVLQTATVLSADTHTGQSLELSGGLLSTSNVVIESSSTSTINPLTIIQTDFESVHSNMKLSNVNPSGSFLELEGQSVDSKGFTSVSHSIVKDSTTNSLITSVVEGYVRVKITDHNPNNGVTSGYYYMPFYSLSN
jgi:hypothetical protein